MGYFLRIVCILFVFACLSSANKFQDFAHKVESLESEISDDRQLIDDVKDKYRDTFTDDELQDILDMELPAMKNCYKIPEEKWLYYGERTFVKILWLALQGEMGDAERLRIQFDTLLSLSKTSVAFSSKWIVLMRFVKISQEEWSSIQEEAQQQYEEEVQRFRREYLEKRAMPLRSRR